MMRKLFYVALVALVALLVLPGAVSAADDTATITITGTVGDYIDLIVTGSPTLTLSPGTSPEDSSATLSVTSNKGWTVAAADQNTGTGTGFMLSGSTSLASPIEIKTASGNYNVLNIGSFFTGTGSGSTTIGVRQAVATGDAPGTYSITIVFTGSTS